MNENFKGGEIPLPEELNIEDSIESRLGFL